MAWSFTRTSVHEILSRCSFDIACLVYPYRNSRSLSSRLYTSALNNAAATRDMYTSLRVPSAHQSSIIMYVACLTLSRCALVLELLVVEVAGVGAGHVESVPITPYRAVRSGIASMIEISVKHPAVYWENRVNRTRRRCPWRIRDLRLLLAGGNIPRKTAWPARCDRPAPVRRKHLPSAIPRSRMRFRRSIYVPLSQLRPRYRRAR